MCEKCDALLRELSEGAEKTVEERVALTAAMGALFKEHGAVTVVDLLANTLGFIDYQVGLHGSEEHRQDMRALFVSLLEDYYRTSDDLVSEDKKSEQKKDPFAGITGSVH